jgi:hypothetical protein
VRKDGPFFSNSGGFQAILKIFTGFCALDSPPFARQRVLSHQNFENKNRDLDWYFAVSHLFVIRC